TFVNTEFNHKRLLNSRGPDSLKGLPDFQFHTIPDGLPPSDIDANQDVPALSQSTSTNCLDPFRKLLSKLNTTADIPLVTCIVSDGIMSFTLQAAQDIGVPEILFYPSSACGFLALMHYLHLMERGLTPLKDNVSYLENGYLDTPIDWIPGMKDIRLRDIPTFIRTTDPNDILFNFFEGEAARAHKAAALILNTFDSLEQEVLNALTVMLPRVYSIGPLQLLLNQIQDDGLDSIGYNLWREEPECLDWLNTKEPGSVVYVNFGSLTVMTPQQIVELAWGLANSEQNLLWIIRPGLMAGDSALPSNELRPQA
ncbi:7-deoxyloganetin glucosyltransferase-like, partial [Macadamia integrifolia]|uniref:7-deoxyloganetin glucosyltransferase-like n=1 Tax=Macadamia integrifolia TaxID=60698 RepID=UPI001C4FD65A